MRATFASSLAFLLSACAGVNATIGGETDDAGVPADAGTAVDAGTVAGDAGAPDAGVPCGSAGATFTCSADGMSREQCVSGSLVTDACSRGCLRSRDGGVDECLTSTWPFSCPGSYGTVPSTSGDYYVTAFGCWTDATGGIHTDPGDNCIPYCLAKAKASGLCLPGDTGPDCEERVTWFTADGARFGCLARLKVTNPANGKSVVAVALDYGPGCSVERSVSFPVLDASGRVDRYLFGADQGASDRSLVHVIQVDDSAPLGPVQ